MAHNLLETFRQESEELLAAIERSALELASGGAGAEVVHELFRAFHTIKGSGAMCGLDRVAEFTHHLENLLGEIRDGRVALEPALGGLVLRAEDHIRELLRPDGGDEAARAAVEARLLEEIHRMAGHAPTCVPAPEHSWTIRFDPNPAMFSWGARPEAVWRDLARLGDCEITGSAAAVPELEEMDPERCYLTWTARLRTRSPEREIHDVFLFVEDGARLEITREGTAAATPPPPEVRRKPAVRDSVVRVPAERLDRLVRLVGEFVMNQSRLAQAAAESKAAEFAGPVQELERLVSELRDNVLGIRMLPIGTLFDRFRRLVYDLSRELGKQCVLETEGAETEQDKSILDQLGEPLVHCLRNAVDHGVETAAQRAAMGKPERATIRLSAVHAGSDVIVRIEDDGRGIDRQAVRAKAVERGLIASDAQLSDRDLVQLVLLPGFSTAQQVTSVSGRGVGMDAVKRQIESLRGSLAVTSREGEGTSVAMTLPLTLAIIDGLLVEIGRDRFIVPLSAVHENVELTAADRRGKNGRNVIAVRGELVPYIDLRAAFAVEGEPPAIEKVIIVQHDGERVGLVVDRVLGTHQTVIQSLGRMFRGIDVVSGATIMGDGRVALIMDVAAVVRHVDRQGAEAAEAA